MTNAWQGQLISSQHINLLGTKIDLVNVDELHRRIFDATTTGLKINILYANVHALNLAYKLPLFRTYLNNAELVFCDGFGVRLGAQLTGQPAPTRITYANWLWQLAEFCSFHGISMYLLGSRPGVAAKAAQSLISRYPDLCIAGTHHGYFDKRQNSSENDLIIEEISRLKPHVLIVCFGMPLQEAWLYDNWSNLDVNVALTGGAALDFISGELKRGPRWLTETGFEWLARLVIEPKRLWYRYVIGNPLFFLRILRQRMGLLHLDE